MTTVLPGTTVASQSDFVIERSACTSIVSVSVPLLLPCGSVMFGEPEMNTVFVRPVALDFTNPLMV